MSGLPSVFVMGAVQVASRIPAVPGAVTRRTPLRMKASPTQVTADRAFFPGIMVSLQGDPPCSRGPTGHPSFGSPAVRLEA